MRSDGKRQPGHTPRSRSGASSSFLRRRATRARVRAELSVRRSAERVGGEIHGTERREAAVVRRRAFETYPLPSAGECVRCGKTPSCVFDLRGRGWRGGVSRATEEQSHDRKRNTRSRSREQSLASTRWRHARQRRAANDETRDAPEERFETMRSRGDAACGVLSRVRARQARAWVLSGAEIDEFSGFGGYTLKSDGA